jgi:SAM-dependent methyltransferase
MPFADASFEVVLCFTMLHHVPTIELQDRLIREARRVLWPGGIFAGSDSRWGRCLLWLTWATPCKSSTPACSPNDLARRASRKSTLAYELQRFASTPPGPMRTRLSCGLTRRNNACLSETWSLSCQSASAPISTAPTSARLYGAVISRDTGYDANITRSVLEACRVVCRSCAAECERHAGMHDHCGICAEACRRCEQACAAVLDGLG